MIKARTRFNRTTDFLKSMAKLRRDKMVDIF